MRAAGTVITLLGTVAGVRPSLVQFDMRGKQPLSLPDEARKRAIASIRRFFTEELDHEIGDLKAAITLDYFLAEVGPSVYNKAVADATTFFAERAADLGALAYQEEFPFWSNTPRHP